MKRAVVLVLVLAPVVAGQTKIIRPKEIDSVLVNPGIGFTTLNRFNGDPLNPGTRWTEGHPIEVFPFDGKLEIAGQPITSIAYFRVYWKYVEPEMGRYNWQMLDTALRTAHERGQTLMLRVAPYGPQGATEDVPEWYRALVGSELDKKFPDKWRTDPEDPRYVKHWTSLVRALGARYDGHPDMEAVDVSIVGYWGEGEHTDQLSEPTMRALVDSYLEEQSLKWHISSFNNKSSAVPDEWRPQVRRWLNRMGYRLVLRRFTYPETVASPGKLTFTSWWENKGVAPCYRRFPLALRLRGEKRSEVLLTGADIRKWLPGDAVYDDAVFLPADLPPGAYDLQIGLLDPQTRTPKVKLAIEGIDGEGWYTLGPIEVRR